MKSKDELSPRRISLARRFGPLRPGSLRQFNARELLSLLRSQGSCSRAELVRLSGLSAPTVSKAIKYLQKKQLVENIGLGASSGGRPPDLWRFTPTYGYVAGVDIEIARLRIALADLDGVIVGRWTVSLRAHRTPEKIVELIQTGVRELLKQNGVSRQKLLAVGAGVPGITDVDAGLVFSAPHLSNWRNVPLRDLLETQLRVPAVVDNDVNVAALGESWRGTAKGISNFVFLALGVGIGAGIFLRGDLYHGSDWAAGEIGYLLIPGGPPAAISLDQPGSLESVIGQESIELTWRKICEESGDDALDTTLNPKQIFDLAQTGNPQARTLLHSTSSLLAEAVSNISVLLNTSLIVFGGSFGTSIPLFEATRRLVEMNQFARPRIAASTLGEEAQLLGALRLALTHVEAKLLTV